MKLAAELLGFKLETKFGFKANPANAKRAVKHPFPTPTTVENALRHYVDLRGTLRKKLLADLSPYCEDETEKQR